MRLQLGNLFFASTPLRKSITSRIVDLAKLLYASFCLPFFGYARKRVAPMKITFGQGVGIRRRTPSYFPAAACARSLRSEQRRLRTIFPQQADHVDRACKRTAPRLQVNQAHKCIRTGARSWGSSGRIGAQDAGCLFLLAGGGQVAEP